MGVCGLVNAIVHIFPSMSGRTHRGTAPCAHETSLRGGGSMYERRGGRGDACEQVIAAVDPVGALLAAMKILSE